MEIVSDTQNLKSIVSSFEDVPKMPPPSEIFVPHKMKVENRDSSLDPSSMSSFSTTKTRKNSPRKAQNNSLDSTSAKSNLASSLHNNSSSIMEVDMDF